MKERAETKNNEQLGIVATNSNVFNKKKNELKSFSENLPKEADLPSVPNSGGLFGLFNYDVTGSDLNRLTERIQDKMIEQNKVLVRTIQEFNTIYDTFSALDREYIQGILISLKAAEEANAKALKGIEGVQENQNEIKQIINQQKQVIQVLKNFKEKIEKIEHLADVDKIFPVFSTMQINVKAIEAISKENKTNIETLNKEVAIYGEKLGDLKRLIQDDIQTLSEKVARNNSEFDAKLDSTTNEVTKNKINFENAIKEVKVGIEQKEESMFAYLESELSKANSEITELSLSIGSLSKLLKTTKVISFASIAITCVLVILIIIGVL